MNARTIPLLRPFLLAATLAAGFGTLWFVLVIWLGTTALEAWSAKEQPPREWIVITADGTPLIQSFPPGNLSLVTYRGLTGRDHESPERKDLLPAVYLDGERADDASLSSPRDWPQRIKVFRDEHEPAALWYFVHDGEPDGAGYFVGYERVSNRLIGYIGLSGFRPDPVPPGDRFPVRDELMLGYSFWSSSPISIDWSGPWDVRKDSQDLPPRLVHVPSGNRLRVVDLGARTVATVFESPESIMSLGVSTLSAYSGSDPTFPRPILVRTRQAIYKLDHEYKVIGTVVLPNEVDRERAITWYETRDGRSVVECSATHLSGIILDVSLTRSLLYRIARDGTIQDSGELILPSGAATATEREQIQLTVAALPAPAVLVPVGVLVVLWGKSARVYPAVLRALLIKSWPSLLLSVLAVSCLLSAFAWRRAREFGYSRLERVLWAGFVLLFGLPAAVGFLVHRRWPVRAPCPHCHRRSPRDRDACAECGTPFPAPALKGIEIFA